MAYSPLNHEQLLDLIYPDARKKRIAEIHSLFDSDHCEAPPKLHRVTLFLTFKCNLKCSYCNTIRAPRSAAPWPTREIMYDFPRFKTVIDTLVPFNIEHLHLTGGESTLVRDLPLMVKYVSDKAIPASLTTNGTASERLYRQLVENGLREIRISCDTHIPEEFDRLVHRRGAYERVLRSIKELVRLRDEEGKPIYIILNMCVGQRNLAHLSSLIEQSIALRPDDIKLIGISHERADLTAYDRQQTVMETIRENLVGYPEEKFPLLRMKIKSVFAQDTYGLKDDTSKRVMKHCLVPLSERVYDSRYYYPCPTYLREGGKPLGRLDEDDFQTQQEKTFRFAKGDSCLEDAICKEFCINCCKKFNVHANAVYNRAAKDHDGNWVPITFLREYDGVITTAEVLSAITEIGQQRLGYRKEIPYQPFLVLKPSGMPHKEQILSWLTAEGITVAKAVGIADWNKVATRLYSVPLNESKVFRGLLMERILPEVESGAAAELWILEAVHAGVRLDPVELDTVKRRIRDQLPPLQCLMMYREEIVLTALSYLHSPSEDSYWIEANLLRTHQSGSLPQN